MSALAESFPSLRLLAGVRPFMPRLIDRQLSQLLLSGSACEPELHAGRLVLSAWHSDHPWDVGRFDLFEALLWWDAEHRAAFVRWVQGLR